MYRSLILNTDFDIMIDINRIYPIYIYGVVECFEHNMIILNIYKYFLVGILNILLKIIKLWSHHKENMKNKN